MPNNHCSPRARGANAILAAKFEATYGVPPSGNYMRLPFVSSALGEEQGLIEDDLLGAGREGLDPTQDVINNDGDITVPVDVRAFGHWLTLYLGAPAAPVAAAAASMKVTFLAQPVANATITVNGTAFTAKASGATGAQFNIGATLADTVTNLAAVLNASVVAGVAESTYAASGAVLTITHDTLGLAGNAFTMAAQAGMNAKLPSGTLTGGAVKHVFSSGAQCLPSLSCEFGHPEIPAYDMNYGVLGNTLRIALQRSGLLNAQLGLIARGTLESTPATGGGAVVDIEMDRFQQARGEILKDGVQLASVVSGSVGFTNNLEKVPSIMPDGRIEGADPGTFRATGESVVVWRDLIMDQVAGRKEAISLSYGWTLDSFSLKFIFPRVFLPKPKRSITGPNGIQRTYNWQASGEGVGAMMTIELVNDVASYA